MRTGGTFRDFLQGWVQAVGVVFCITLVTQQDVLAVIILPAYAARFVQMSVSLYYRILVTKECVQA